MAIGHDPRKDRVKGLRRVLAVALVGFAAISCESPASRPAAMPMGSPADVAYAARLWSAMQAARLVGPHARRRELFFGGAKPHGTILELASRTLAVGGHSGFLVVKKNYNGPGVSEEAVARDRARYLSSITIMYRREKGYDADNQDWFWVKYRPDGTLFRKSLNGRDVAMAGRILKGRTPEDNGGCIYCHRSAGGGDYIFYPEVRPPRGARS